MMMMMITFLLSLMRATGLAAKAPLAFRLIAITRRFCRQICKN